ncbi:nuclease [Sinorhizobium meliloti]|uniref:endonuclease/exonuclease/phosphatase family protein n=1 Tax=Rhizobium meliloti TaxID=382 RepID=UPI000FDB2F04|nr:endonuclease/exonuclease/phosphatase family protein [Sinorhizobium meliloti]RVH76905.1 nuclease [Sinorhizobium meliloti]RVM20670.1 nuclease [Sinorhizobium meliloti]RVN99509.1 nuclease [Sinorhizobium meliloti]WQP09410.1 endonuclease/exonuclease/phosphatase family protein [Sinorhizobium meliloti]WQP36254.1 endonuclease/exonuclease/phosphatase family protein [Sinorhizobium meliloti]
MSFRIIAKRLAISVTFATMLPVINAAQAAQSLTIPQIQGAGSTSSFVGRTVKTRGVVTLVRKVRGDTILYVQDTVGDNDANTSDAISVSVNSPGDIKPGDLVDVEGQVTEVASGANNLSVTSISPAIVKKGGQVTLPAPIVIDEGGRLPPTQAIAGATSRTGIGFFESLEGMRVEIRNAVVTGPTNDHGELWVVGDDGRHATGMNSYGGITATPGDLNPERVQIQLEKPFVDPAAYQLKVGDKIPSVAGVIDYSFGNFELVATNAAAAIPAIYPSTSPLESGPDFLTVGSYNVENLDPKKEVLALVYDKKEIDDDIGDGRFKNIAEHIVSVLGAPDIMALQEIQDNDGAEISDIVAADVTLKTLATAIRDAGGPTYKWIDVPPKDDEEGGQPGGNIRVAFLYQPAKAETIAGKTIRIEDPSFAATRLPLAVSFRIGGKVATVVNVHWSSKGGSDPLYGTVQPPRDGTVAKRSEQARAVQAFLRTLPVEEPVIVVGDFNTFWYEEPLQVLTGGLPAFENLTLRDQAAERFSYNFEGNAQALDHALVSSNASARAEFRTFHVNSLFPEAQQMSDHDPKVVRLRLQN